MKIPNFTTTNFEEDNKHSMMKIKDETDGSPQRISFQKYFNIHFNHADWRKLSKDRLSAIKGKLSINSNSKQYTAKQAGTNKQEHVPSNSDLGCAELNSLFVQSDFVLMKEGDDHFVSWPLKAYKGDVACAQLDCQDMNEDSVKIDLMPVKVIAIKEWIKIDTEWMQNALNEAQKGNDQYIVKQYSIQQVVRLAHRVKNNAKGDQVIVIRKGQIIGAIQSLVEQTESTDNTYYVKRVDELVGITDIDDKSDKKSKKRRKKKTTKKTKKTTTLNANEEPDRKLDCKKVNRIKIDG
eukprot:1106314_1